VRTVAHAEVVPGGRTLRSAAVLAARCVIGRPSLAALAAPTT